jgi:death-on-curing protein
LAAQVAILSVDDIYALHDEALTLGIGGSEGVRSHHQVASAALQPYQTVFGEDAYPSIPEKAAAHAFFLAESQPFVDGNKRTAALALTVFLDLNDYELYEASETELADVLIELGSGNIEQGEFFGWVCNHAKPKPQGGC